MGYLSNEQARKLEVLCMTEVTNRYAIAAAVGVGVNWASKYDLGGSPQSAATKLCQMCNAQHQNELIMYISQAEVPTALQTFLK